MQIATGKKLQMISIGGGVEDNVVKSPSLILGNGATAARVSLEDKILVRIQVPQLDPSENDGF